MAPMKVESSDHLPVSKYIIDAHVMALVEAQRFVTHITITGLKLRLSVVPASRVPDDY